MYIEPAQACRTLHPATALKMVDGIANGSWCSVWFELLVRRWEDASPRVLLLDVASILGEFA